MMALLLGSVASSALPFVPPNTGTWDVYVLRRYVITNASPTIKTIRRYVVMDISV